MDGAAPVVVVIERDRDLAVVLLEVVMLARCRPLTLRDIDELKQLASPPAAVVIRIAGNLSCAAVPRAGLKNLAGSLTTQVLALTSNDEDVAEATRLGSDVVLRQPRQVQALYDSLTNLAGSRRGRP
jgi:hypothetical protein